MSQTPKGRIAGKVATAKTAAPEKDDHVDQLVGWFNLAKPSRNRQQKRGWQRRAK